MRGVGVSGGAELQRLTRGRGGEARLERLYVALLEACGLATDFGGQRFAVEPDVFFPSAFVEADVGVAGDVLEIKTQQTALPRGAAVTDDVLIGRDPGLFQLGLRFRERSELVGVVLLHQARPVEADRA